MSVLALLIALALHQILRPDNALQTDQWLYALDLRLRDAVATPVYRSLWILLLTLVIGAWALDLLREWMFGLPALLASTGLFVWALGRADYHTALERYESLRETNGPAACEAASALWMPAEPDSAFVADTVAPDLSAAALPPAMLAAQQRLVYGGYARWFAPVFYALLAGPLGAVAYRLLALLTARDASRGRLTLLHVLNWLPSRLLALSFALTGDFAAVTRPALLARIFSVTGSASVLCSVARAATSAGESARPLGELLFRTGGLWLVAILVIYVLR